MALASQSQQWFPTSVQVTVHQARSLRVKGKNGTNDAYAIIQLAKDKFSTSVAEKCVAPVWKEEASFDLPLFHPGNAERCTLYIIVMHRAQVGLDKFLGQAVINLLDQHDNSPSKKSGWFKLVDKTGKEDKERGEVLLDIQFMRNNMSASMLDLSMQDKPRSRISKLKDKVRGKKKDGFSDSASAIVPSVNQVLTDSEGEADAQSLNQSSEGKKKSKLKTLFAPKSNLQRNISQSMSTLGTFPEKNSSLSGSRSSGLNVDSPDVKKKFKLLGHKRTGSSDSKVSQGPFSLLGRSKQSNNDLNSLCINGSHVYAEEAEEGKSGSTLSLNSSGQGSMEDVRKQASDISVESSKSIPVPSIKHETADRATLEQQRHREEEERKQAEERRRVEERRIAEAKRLEDEERHRAEVKKLKEEEERRYREEQERKRRFLEDETKRKKQREEEEERKKQDEERRMLEAKETQKLEEERRRVEEQKRQEEASMSERLTSLFGMIKKKEEKKEEMQPPKEELSISALSSESRDPHHPIPHHSTNPFEDIPLSSDLPASSNKSPGDHQTSSTVNTPTPSATVFLNRTAKVSAVKPRLTQSLDSESAENQTPSQPCPSPADSTFSSVPSDSPDTFSSLHSSLAPPHKSLLGLDFDSIENISSLGSSPQMADQKQKGSVPPMYFVHGMQPGQNVPVREIVNPAYVDADRSQPVRKAPPTLPDYETLFPKRHGVQGQMKWDNVIAEVNQKHKDTPSEFLEMSVDGPDEQEINTLSLISKEPLKTYQQATKPISTKTVAAPAPPTKPIPSSHANTVADFSQRKNQSITRTKTPLKPNPSSVTGPANTEASSRGSPIGMSGNEPRKALMPPAETHSLTPVSQIETTESEDERKAPKAKPRHRVSAKEPSQQDKAAVTLDEGINSNIQSLFTSNGSTRNKKSQQTEDFVDFNPFPTSDLLPEDPWAQPLQNEEVDDIFKQKPKDQRETDGFDDIFSRHKTTDPSAAFDGSDLYKDSVNVKQNDDLKQPNHVIQRRNSPRAGNIALSSRLNNKGFKPKEQVPEREVTVTTASKDHQARQVLNESGTGQPQADVKAKDIFSGKDLFGAEPFKVLSGSPSSQPLQVVMEEPASLSGGLSGGKTLLRARVSPSESSPVSAQNSLGGGLALTSRRPHPVKPLSSVESQPPTSAVVKEIKVRDTAPQKIKMIDAGESGPYTQLTQEELITLVVKQQTDLSRKDAKIVELEEYIDNLLVRVIDEQPSILQSLNSAKPV